MTFFGKPMVVLSGALGSGAAPELASTELVLSERVVSTGGVLEVLRILSCSTHYW